MKKKKASSKERMRTEIEYRRIKSNLEQYIKKCQKLANDNLEKGKQAARTNNTSMMRQFAIGYNSMTEKRLAAERILISMEAMNLDVENEELAGSFLNYAKMFDNVSSGGKIKEKEYEKLLRNIAEKDMKFNNIIDAITDRMLLTDETELDGIIEEMTRNEEESELDKKLNEILDLMREEKDSRSKREREKQERQRLLELLELLERRRGGPSRINNDSVIDDIEDKLREIERHLGRKQGRKKR